MQRTSFAPFALNTSVRPSAGASTAEMSPEAAYVLVHKSRHAELILEPARQAALAALDGVLPEQDINEFSQASAITMTSTGYGMMTLLVDLRL